MEFFNKFISNFDYLVKNIDQVFSLSIEHIKLTALAVAFAILIGVPLGILISYYKKASKPVVGVANVVQAIPSMALLGLAIPLLGIGDLPSITMVILYSLLPIIKNTYTGIVNINKDTMEAAKAIGLTKLQILGKVQIPLALPVIMAGVRVSAVTAVGLMTMAAFIGAGGLGYLIFSGISTTNNAQIIAGAIPACILALIVDSLFGLVEKLVTPISLQSTTQSKEALKKTRRNQKGILGVSAAIIILLFTVTAIQNNMNKSDKTIIVGGKDFSEQQILTHMFSDIIEDKTDIRVVRKPNLGGTQVCFNALASDELDLYIEYTGTAYGDTLSYPPITDPVEIYNTVKNDFKEEHDIEVLKQMEVNNTYTVAVPQEVAEEYNLVSISDLAQVSDQLIGGFALEFLNRDDGLPGLENAYGLFFKDNVGMNGTGKYIALDNGETHATDAFATDGLLKKYELVVLEDDKEFFPPYYAIPLIRAEILEEYPELEEIINDLGSILTDEIMVELNYQVDELQERPENVARTFLEENDLIN